MLRRDSTGQLTARLLQEPGGPPARSGDPDPCSAGGIPAHETSLRQQSMASLIADEIIPRLIAAHRFEQGVPCGDGAPRLDAACMADLAVHSDARHLADLSEAAMADGLEFESLLLDVMAPAARLLGEKWEDDSADFIEVTLGLWRLQELVHELASRRCGTQTAPVLRERRILCTVVPGDDHSFGSLVLEEMFRRAGWACTGLRDGTRSQLIRQVEDAWFEIIALTVSVERNSVTLADLVADLRAASCNPGVSIMVGGPVFNDLASLADEIGADATASDARGALFQAELLVGQYLARSGVTASGGALLHGGSGHPAARAGIQPG